MSVTVDFCVHQIVRIRLIDAGPHEVALVQRQIGPLQAQPVGRADLVLRFTDEGPDEHDLRLLGQRDAGFTSDSFWTLRGSHRRPQAIELPLDRVGGLCELRCQRPLPGIPLLQSLINLIALVKGYLPLHASAFLDGAHGGLVTGWAQGGKTEALLGFAEQGAAYVGDEWIQIQGDGQRMYGMQAPVQLWDWHLDSPRLRARLRAGQRWKLRLSRLLHAASRRPLVQRSLGAKTASRFTAWCHARRHVQLSAERLFADCSQTAAACPRRIFFVASHAASEVCVRAMPVAEIIRRMAVSLEDEFSELLACYRQFRFAFPERRNHWLDQLPELLTQRLERALGDKEGFAVWHPYPVSPRSLYEAMRPYVQDQPEASAARTKRTVGATCDATV